MTLKATPARWWGAHKETIQDRYQCKRLLRIRFCIEQGRNKMKRYDGKGTLAENLEKCMTMEYDTTKGMASSLHPYI
jgi:hypothetical protein